MGEDENLETQPFSITVVPKELTITELMQMLSDKLRNSYNFREEFEQELTAIISNTFQQFPYSGLNQLSADSANNITQKLIQGHYWYSID